MTARGRTGTRRRIGLILSAAVLGWAVYAYGAIHSPLLNRELAERQAYLDRHARDASINVAEEGKLAEIYWGRYPDVANDAYFGRAGAMGILGARAHFQRHGRREGRAWGPIPAGAPGTQGSINENR